MVDRAPWVTVAGVAPSLEIAMLKHTVVLSWSQFVYAEGGDDEIRVAFASHDGVVRGAGLSALLQAITSQQVTSIREPARADRFSGNAGRLIREIAVRRLDGE